MSARTVEERCREWLRERGCPSVTECHASMAEFVTSLLAEAVAGERERHIAEAERHLARTKRPAMAPMTLCPTCGCPKNKHLTFEGGDAIIVPCAVDGCYCTGAALRAAPKEDR